MSDNPHYQLSDHAREEAERRGISTEVLDSILHSPEQIVEVHSGRKAYQSKVEIEAKLYVIRAIVEILEPLRVITVYRTSKIEKYWSDES